MAKDFFSASDMELTEAELLHLKKEAATFTKRLKSAVKKSRISAEVFVGGSLAKETLLKKDTNDIDIFVRFDRKYEGNNLSDLLSKIIKNLRWEASSLRVHGSRDYFQLKKKEVLFEVVPVLKIKNPIEAQNVTDLSYFHVNYVKKALKNRRIEKREIIKAKSFCKALGIYGAESYIRGFSGYGLECMIINYKSFKRMASSIIRAKGKIILDPEKRYNSKEEILIELNESKLRSPIILVDPTWKERNVLAALSEESFETFVDALRKFMKNPSPSFFRSSPKNEKEVIDFAQKNNAQLLQVVLETEKQEGDIAGTKLKKFFRLLTQEISREFEILKTDFHYAQGKQASASIVGIPKIEVIYTGPMLSLKEELIKFKAKHAKTFIKEDRIYARENAKESLKCFVEEYKKRFKTKVFEMDVSRISIKNSKDFRDKR